MFKIIISLVVLLFTNIGFEETALRDATIDAIKIKSGASGDLPVLPGWPGTT